MANMDSDTKKRLAINGQATSAVLDAFVDGYNRADIKVAVLASAKHIDSKALDLLVTGLEAFDEALDILAGNIRSICIRMGEELLDTEEDEDTRTTIMTKLDQLRRIEDMDGDLPVEPSDKEYLRAIDRIEALLR